MLIWIVIAALLVAFAVSVRLDPRTFRTGVFLFAGLALAVVAILGEVLTLVERFDIDVAGWVLVGFLLLGLLAMVVLGILLVLAGLLVLRRARRTLPNLLALLLGLLVLAYVAAGVIAVARWDDVLISVLMLVGLPAGYLGSGLVVFIGYGWLYRVLIAGARRPVDAVVVLGAGLRGRQVTPQLATRLDRGRVAYQRSVAAGRTPIMVVSGGQGPDEVVSEAEAMRDYLIAQGIPPEAVVMEDRSRNTSQNLQFSRALLAERGITGPVTVATSNYHALRAAMLMRRWKVAGHSVGSRTARYMWANAVIREYLAILRDHLVLNLIAVGVLLLPLLLVVLRLLIP